ncbi:hypothetical protein [Maribacter arcticus]|uniref:Uncharacterized protein n=1 Tax=Maribacter arcticus TaxID=561365 RepID=A0A1T4ZQZ9_9FLAO|nr:hypothetical protein [Maribacter arcticus]SKB24979.1 hypothetical protein SAMN05660866_00125 [Maribacter arcticus]
MNGEKGFAEIHPSSGYAPIKGRIYKGELRASHITDQTLQMDGMAQIIFDVNVVPVDGEEVVKDLKIIDTIYLVVK